MFASCNLWLPHRALSDASLIPLVSSNTIIVAGSLPCFAKNLECWIGSAAAAKFIVKIILRWTLVGVKLWESKLIVRLENTMLL